jgi:transketolase
MRKTFVDTLTELARVDHKVMCVIGDTGFSVFEEFEKEFKERFVNVGIAEQNFVSFGAGLAAMGMKPFLYNVVSFMTLRGMEQIVLDICYQDNPVVMVGVGGGHAYGAAGPTHHSYFDIGMMSMLPNMTVICPADPVEMREAIIQTYRLGKPAYIRIGRSVDPVIHQHPTDFQIGKAIKIQEGTDGVLFATGTMVKDGISACNILKEYGIRLGLYSMHTIKPLDEETVLSCAKQKMPIFTLEEHSKKGGLGSMIGELLSEKGCYVDMFYKFGFPDMFAPVTGTREFLNKLYKIDPESVADKIKDLLKNKPIGM